MHFWSFRLFILKFNIIIFIHWDVFFDQQPTNIDKMDDDFWAMEKLCDVVYSYKTTKTKLKLIYFQ